MGSLRPVRLCSGCLGNGTSNSNRPPIPLISCATVNSKSPRIAVGYKPIGYLLYPLAFNRPRKRIDVVLQAFKLGVESNGGAVHL